MERKRFAVDHSKIGISKTYVLKFFDPNIPIFGQLSNNAQIPVEFDRIEYPTVTNFILSNMMTRPLNRNFMRYAHIKGEKKKTDISLKIADVVRNSEKFRGYRLSESDVKKIEMDVKKEVQMAKMDIYELFRYFQRMEEDSAIQEAVSTAYTVKSKTNPDFRSALLNTGNKEIVYRSRNTFLGKNEDGKGINYIGIFLMQLRRKLSIEAEYTLQYEEKQSREKRIFLAYKAELILQDELDSGGYLEEYTGKTPTQIISTYRQKYRNDQKDPEFDDMLEAFNEGKDIRVKRDYKSTYPALLGDTETYDGFVDSNPSQDLLNTVMDMFNNRRLPIVSKFIRKRNESSLTELFMSKNIGKLTEIIINRRKMCVFRVFCEFFLKEKFPNMGKGNIDLIIRDIYTVSEGKDEKDEPVIYSNYSKVVDRVEQLYISDVFPGDLTEKIKAELKKLPEIPVSRARDEREEKDERDNGDEEEKEEEKEKDREKTSLERMVERFFTVKPRNKEELLQEYTDLSGVGREKVGKYGNIEMENRINDLKNQGKGEYRIFARLPTEGRVGKGIYVGTTSNFPGNDVFNKILEKNEKKGADKIQGLEERHLSIKWFPKKEIQSENPVMETKNPVSKTEDKVSVYIGNSETYEIYSNDDTNIFSPIKQETIVIEDLYYPSIAVYISTRLLALEGYKENSTTVKYSKGMGVSKARSLLITATVNADQFSVRTGEKFDPYDKKLYEEEKYKQEEESELLEEKKREMDKNRKKVNFEKYVKFPRKEVIFYTPDECNRILEEKRRETHYKLLIFFAKLGLMKKFETSDMQTLLVLTGESRLSWNDLNDAILGIGPNKNGENFVGKYLEKLREGFQKLDFPVRIGNIRGIIKDPFIEKWIKMRTLDLCNTVYLVKRNFLRNYNVIVPITPESVDIILRDCHPLLEIVKSKYSMTDIPDEKFIEITKECQGIEFTPSKNFQAEISKLRSKIALHDIRSNTRVINIRKIPDEKMTLGELYSKLEKENKKEYPDPKKKEERMRELQQEIDTAYEGIVEYTSGRLYINPVDPRERKTDKRKTYVNTLLEFEAKQRLDWEKEFSRIMNPIAEQLSSQQLEALQDAAKAASIKIEAVESKGKSKRGVRKAVQKEKEKLDSLLTEQKRGKISFSTEEVIEKMREFDEKQRKEREEFYGISSVVLSEEEKAEQKAVRDVFNEQIKQLSSSFALEKINHEKIMVSVATKYWHRILGMIYLLDGEIRKDTDNSKKDANMLSYRKLVVSVAISMYKEIECEPFQQQKSSCIIKALLNILRGIKDIKYELADGPLSNGDVDLAVSILLGKDVSVEKKVEKKDEKKQKDKRKNGDKVSRENKENKENGNERKKSRESGDERKKSSENGNKRIKSSESRESISDEIPDYEDEHIENMIGNDLPDEDNKGDGGYGDDDENIRRDYEEEPDMGFRVDEDENEDNAEFGFTESPDIRNHLIGIFGDDKVKEENLVYFDKAVKFVESYKLNENIKNNRISYFS